MRYEQRYQGRLIVATTTKMASGWTSEVKLDGEALPPDADSESDRSYPSEDEARQAAVSAAAAAIDRMRQFRGKS